LVNGTVHDLAHSAVQHVRQHLGMQVCAVAQLTDLLDYLQAQADKGEASTHLPAVQAYRDRYGVN
ncbi:MAG: orotate phosphoribosyltransferase, partial [Betaproteobacteria bacterium]|nr:orotate phosphoribosyltransferase [Betaproteobacteria bacterium]